MRVIAGSERLTTGNWAATAESRGAVCEHAPCPSDLAS